MVPEVLRIEGAQGVELEVSEREDLRGDASDRVGFGHADSIAERPTARRSFSGCA